MRGRGTRRGGRWRLLLLIGAVWLALVFALATAERGAPGAQIGGLGDALWYSLVTVSTVGYGDVVPVSMAGRLIGSAFVLLSTGLLAALLGMAVSAFSGRLFAPLRVALARGRNKYIFTAWNAQCDALARNLLREDPNAMFVALEEAADAGDVRPLTLRAEPERAVRLARGGTGRTALFLMDARQPDNLAAAARLSPLGVPVYCRTEAAVPWAFPNVTFFSAAQCCARRYWQAHPAAGPSERIALLGGGRLCAELLEQALLVNVFGEKQEIVYHVSGAMEDFVSAHAQLGNVVSVNAFQPGRDSVFFHGVKWSGMRDALAQADRIVVCEDDDAENLEILLALRRLLPTGARVHVKQGRLRGADALFAGETFFGSEEEIFTADLVMRERQSALARRMHALYLEGCGGDGPSWEALSEFTRASNLAVADHLYTKIHILLPGEEFDEITPALCARAYAAYLRTRGEPGERYRRIEHERFVRFHELRNWIYAPTRDNAARKHPLLCPFDDLAEAERAKDDYAWEILGRIGEKDADTP